MLEVDDVHAYYGKSHILQGVSFGVGEGEIVSLLGRNGAGRSTAVKTIMGLVAPVGRISFRGERIDGLAPHQIARRGLGYVPEDREIFPSLTVRENLLLGMKNGNGTSRWTLDGVCELFPMLRHRIDAPGGVLKEAKVGGQPIDPRREYRLALPNFSAGGGDGYPKLNTHPGYVDTGFTDADVLRAYIASNSPLKAADFAPPPDVVRR